MKKTYGKLEVVTDEQLKNYKQELKELAYWCWWSSTYYSFGTIDENYERVYYGNAQAGDIVVETATHLLENDKMANYEIKNTIVPYFMKKIRKDESALKCRMVFGSVWRKKELIDKKRNALASCYYICSDCVKENGGSFVKGRCYTAHTSICPVCGKEKSLGCVSDFDWPKDSDVRKLGREI